MCSKFIRMGSSLDVHWSKPIFLLPSMGNENTGLDVVKRLHADAWPNLAPHVDSPILFVFLHQKLPNNWSFPYLKYDMYLEVRKLLFAGQYSLILPVLYQYFSRCDKDTCIYTTDSIKILCRSDDLAKSYFIRGGKFIYLFNMLHIFGPLVLLANAISWYNIDMLYGRIFRTAIY